ncbi:hypothetical protein AAG906_029964 [Vitis piasezkii]
MDIYSGFVPFSRWILVVDFLLLQTIETGLTKGTTQIRPQHTLFLEPPSLILVPSKRLGQDWE